MNQTPFDLKLLVDPARHLYRLALGKIPCLRPGAVDTAAMLRDGYVVVAFTFERGHEDDGPKRVEVVGSAEVIQWAKKPGVELYLISKEDIAPLLDEEVRQQFCPEPVNAH
jgi:hypothetical protein